MKKLYEIGGIYMESTEEVLQTRTNYLLQLKEQKEKALETAPEGMLRICNSRNRTQYYQRIDPTDLNGKYINEKEFSLARTLAQKDYDKKVLLAIEKELYAIKKFTDNYPEINAEKIYENLHKVRQKLVIPIQESEEEFVRKWENVTYEEKGFRENTPEFYTVKGERVRSKSEVIIADLLNREGIPYRYECPIYLKGYGRIYPDFTVLNIRTRKEFYWEHLGMMDDSTYVENALKKIATYERNGIFIGNGLILTYESKNMPINQKQIQQVILHYLQ